MLEELWLLSVCLEELNFDWTKPVKSLENVLIEEKAM